MTSHIFKITLCISFALMVFISCKRRVEPLYFQHHTFINNSGHNMVITGYFGNNDSTYIIKNKDSIVQSANVMFGLSGHIIAHADSVKIVYGKQKVQKFKRKEKGKRNLLNTDNLTIISTAQSSRTYKYTFTEADYNAATDCNGKCE